MSGQVPTSSPSSEPFPRLKFWNLLIDTVVKVVSPLGILLAAVVAYGTYLERVRSAENAARLEMLLELHVDTESTEITDSDSNAVVVTVSILNRGTRTLKPYYKKNCDNGIQGEGCTISVTRHDTIAGPPNDMSHETDPLVPFEGTRVRQRTNILSPRYDYGKENSWHRRYGLLPNTEYREREALVLKSGFIYEIVARFYIENPLNGCDPFTVSETTFLHIPLRKTVPQT